MSNISLNQLRKSYGAVDVIKGIDLDIKQGEFCVFVGPSGCGKSTLLRMISGLEEISSGEIRIGDKVMNDLPAADRGLAMVFQSYALYPHMSVRQNLSFGLENINVSRSEINKKVNEVSQMLQIEQLLDRRPKDLSGGQRQRVAIGRAVVREPQVFLFDEPLSNLDAELRVTMRGEIAALHKRLGNTMVYVTHDQVEAMTMADKIAVLRLGLLEQFATPLELYNAPANMFVAGFIGSPKMNFVAGRVSETSPSTLVLESGEQLPLPETGFDFNPGMEVTLGLRPTDLQPSADGELTVEVGNVEQLGGESYAYCKAAGGAAITLHQPGQTEMQSGERVSVKIPTDRVHLFSTESGQTLRSAQPA